MIASYGGSSCTDKIGARGTFIEDPSLTLSSSALCCFAISSWDQVAGCRSVNVALRAFWPSKVRIDIGLSQDMGQTRWHTRITANNFSPSWRNLFGVISPFLNRGSSPRRQAAQQYGSRVWPIKGDRERAQGVSEQIVPVFMVHPHAGLLSVVSEARCSETYSDQHRRGRYFYLIN